LRLAYQVVKLAHVYMSVAPMRTLHHLVRVYVKEARSADTLITLILRPLEKKMQNVDDYATIDVDDLMPDMSTMQRHRFIEPLTV